jgi:hypothetical protein
MLATCVAMTQADEMHGVRPEYFESKNVGICGAPQ